MENNADVFLTYWDGCEVKQVYLDSIKKAYTIQEPVHPEKTKKLTPWYDVKVETVWGTIIVVKQAPKDQCVRYLEGFESVGFVKSWAGNIWYNPDRVDPKELGEDLATAFPYPYFTTKEV